MDETGALPGGAPTPDVHRDCGSHLVVTADAGQSRQERPLPGEPAAKDAGVALVFGRSLMLWVDSPGAVAIGGLDRRYWTTTDGGLTWTESATPRDTGPPDRCPPSGSTAGQRFSPPTHLAARARSGTRVSSPPRTTAASGAGARIRPASA